MESWPALFIGVGRDARVWAGGGIATWTLAGAPTVKWARSQDRNAAGLDDSLETFGFAAMQRRV